MSNKYLDGNSLLAVKKCLDKAYYNLGAFDTVDTSNADYDLITRQTGYITFDGSESWQSNSQAFGYTIYFTPLPNYTPACVAGGIQSFLSGRSRGEYVSTLQLEQFVMNDLVFSNEKYLIIRSDTQPNLQGAILQYKLSTPYTEKVIKNQPLKPLDSKDIAVVELSSSSGILTDEQFDYLLKNENALIKRSGRYYRRYLKDSSSINFVSITQAINQTTNMDLYMPKVVITLSSKAYSFSASNDFYYSKDQADSKFAKEDEMAEIKSLVYDNQVPAVAKLPVLYAKNYALQSQISGDKIIMSAGMDMTKVRGRSCVVNNLNNNSIWAITGGNGTLTENTDEFVITANANLSGVNFGVGQNLNGKLVNGHKYLIGVSFKASRVGSEWYQIVLQGNISGWSPLVIPTPTANVYSTVYGIVNVTEISGTQFAIIVTTGSATLESGDTMTFKKELDIVDLTQWFGSNDAIPTDLLADPSLFTKKYWQGELPYDTGHIEDSKPIKVVSVGFNKWDEEWEVGGISSSNGQNDNSVTTRIRSKGYIKVFPNTTYYLKNGGSGNVWVFNYDINKNYKGYRNITNSVFTTESTDGYIRICPDADYGSTYNNNICINISNTALNGKYLPFQKNEYPIIPIQTATIEIGTVSWNNSQTMSNTFLCGLPNIKHSDNVIASLSNAQYQRYYSTTDLENAESGYYVKNNGLLYVKDTNYPSAGDFVTGNRGMTITYEVANQPYEPLRSAGSVQDDNKKVKAGVVDLGSINWELIGAGATQHNTFSGSIPNIKTRPYEESGDCLLCAIYTGVNQVGWDEIPNMCMRMDSNSTNLMIANDTYSNANDFKTAMSGVYLNYELATPTEQSPAFTLPENIEIQKGGTIEIVYDDGYSAPCDIDFEVAVSKVLEE